MNIASMLTWFGGPRVPAYTASKGGIAALTRSLAVAWAKHGPPSAVVEDVDVVEGAPTGELGGFTIRH